MLLAPTVNEATTMTAPSFRSRLARALLLSLPPLILLRPNDALAGGLDLFQQGLARGPLYAALTAFLGGLLVCLTPCVYPMVAITVSVFGKR